MDIKKIREGKVVTDQVELLLQTAYNSNKEFNEEFDSTGPVLIPGLRDRSTLYDYQPSEVLYWVDRNAYFDEFDFWNGERHDAEHLEAREFLKSSDQMAVFNDLVDAISRRRVAPFVGAGLSRPCGYPTWSEALSMLATKIPGVKTTVRKSISAMDFLGAAQVLSDASSYQVTNYIRTEFRLRNASDGTPILQGPITILPEISFGCIVTTNFDSLIEEVFERKLDGYMHGIQPGNNFVPRLLRGERCILKLHGDAMQENSHVFTRSQYVAAYGEPLNFKKQLPRTLRQIYISYSLLFLGCSLEKDTTLDLFGKVHDEGHFEIPDHFAILPEPRTSKVKTEKADRLLAMSIRPIWYDDPTHGMVEKLLRLASALSKRQVSLS